MKNADLSIDFSLRLCNNVFDMYDLISIGDITIDLFFKGVSLTTKQNRFYLAIGGKYHADHFYESLGGGSANVAAGCSHFGVSAAVIGKIGENSFKQLIIQKLIRKGVSSEFLLHEKEYINISCIFLAQKGERTIVHYTTPYVSFSLTEAIKQIAKPKIVYMGNLPGVSIEDRKRIAAFFKRNRALLCLNFGVTDCALPISRIRRLLTFADILILNTHEFGKLVKKPREKIDFTKNCATLLRFNDKLLVLTDGERGSFAYFQKKVYHQKAVTPQKIVDTTGAGDAFTSGFLSAYLKEKLVEKALLRGAEYASRIIGKIGAQ
ncbi:MAG TPA: carbohydrate kinase family protein [Patescibacteria group bacterium]|nr:carbohydrate kinase family protein [Patescibacteria group bacterium]